MALIEQQFIASNGNPVQFFETEQGENVKAHVFWFSAFTHGPYLGKLLKTEQKFHGFRAANTFEEFDFTLLRDNSGPTSDGTYYFGKANNPFIENAISEFIAIRIAQIRESKPGVKIIGIGSSMGAYGATKFGIIHQFDSVVALVPHFDLNAARAYCGRKMWIDWAGEGGTEEEQLFYLNRLQLLVTEYESRLPPVFCQSAKDDAGVHEEQVIPFSKLYKNSGGIFFEDFRKDGGHSMTNASNEYIRAVLNLMADNRNFNPGMFDEMPKRIQTRSEILEQNFAKVENFAGKCLRFVGLLKRDTN